MGFGIVGALIGAAIEELGDISRAAIAASLRKVADDVERGDLVSDAEIDKMKGSTSKIRDMLERSKSP